jgi:hypothetical protein
MRPGSFCSPRHGKYLTQETGVQNALDNAASNIYPALSEGEYGGGRQRGGRRQRRGAEHGLTVGRCRLTLSNPC